MQRSNLSQTWWWTIILFIAAAIIAADQATKIWIQRILVLGQSIPETGLIRLTYVQNTGGAFSIFHGKADLLAVASIIGATLMLLYIFFGYRRYPFLNTPLNKIATGVLLGGTVGNLIDRVYRGYVIDFIDIGPWPVMNIADICITTGVILFSFSMLLMKQDSESVERQTSNVDEIGENRQGENSHCD